MLKRFYIVYSFFNLLNVAIESSSIGQDLFIEGGAGRFDRDTTN